MKGFVSETLIACGALSFSQSVTLSIVLLSLGTISGIVRYAVELNRMSKKEALYDSACTFINKLVEAPNHFDVSAFSKEIH
tara:strand:- start:6691 stop:6933 length:243 start_codon:yes stop_codon:yes gene_type:complete